MEGRQEIDAPSTIRGGDPAPVLQFVKLSFNQVAFLVEVAVIFPRCPPFGLGRYARRGAPGAGETAGFGVHRGVVDFGGVVAAGLEKHSIPVIQCRHKTTTELSPENWSSIGVRILGNVKRCSD